MQVFMSQVGKEKERGELEADCSFRSANSETCQPIWMSCVSSSDDRYEEVRLVH